MAEINLFRLLDQERLQQIPWTISTGTLGIEEFKAFKVASIPYTPCAMNAYCINWNNPEDVPILVWMTISRITVGAAGGATMDLGTSATASANSNNLMTVLDINATGLTNNRDDVGASGIAVQAMDANGGTTAWITGQVETAAATTLVGMLYILYTTLDYSD